MCGILGAVTVNDCGLDLSEALKSLNHRGPDARGIFYYSQGRCRLGLGHTRLSIQDVSSKADQPLSDPSQRFTLIYNGEVYNYRRLRSRYLEDVRFDTDSDTEVLIRLFERFGPDAFSMLEGMFALAIFDRVTLELTLARDAMGIKPLYYSVFDDTFAFASEIRALEALGCSCRVSRNDLRTFLAHGFLFEPNTGFENVKKIPPGTYAQLPLINSHLDRNISFTKIEPEKWDESLLTGDKPTKYSKQDLVRDLLKSIDDHMVSSVPVCNLFSAGVDSALIASELRNNTQFIAYSEENLEDARSDINFARTIASQVGLTLQEVKLESLATTAEFLEKLMLAVEVVEEPSSDLTILPILELSKVIQERNYKVMLNGTGADEIFWGYPKYKLFSLYEALSKMGINQLLSAFVPPINSKFKRMKRALRAATIPEFYKGMSGYFSDGEVDRLLGTISTHEFAPGDSLLMSDQYDRQVGLRELEFRGFLSRNLLLLDKGTMWHSVEGRVPYVTPSLVANTDKLSRAEFQGITKTKAPLREYLKGTDLKPVVTRSKRAFHPALVRSLGECSFNELESFYPRYVWQVLNKKACIEIFSTDSQPFLKRQQLLLLLSWLARYVS